MKRIFKKFLGFLNQISRVEYIEEVTLRGDNSFRNDAIGESHYQNELEEITGGRTEDGHEYACEACLVLEDDNPYDRMSVAIEIDGKKIGHISKHEAPYLREELAKIEANAKRASCKAMIVGGWERADGDKGYFGVKLDFIRPLRR